MKMSGKVARMALYTASLLPGEDGGTRRWDNSTSGSGLDELSCRVLSWSMGYE